jgi:hypothetical protein
MLRDARATALARNFATQWLRIRDLGAAHAGVDDALERAMVLETVMFFDAILREERPITELLVADFTFVDERLARHYGIPGVRGPEMRRVPADGVRRGGVLTQGAVLLATSNPTRTSPVKRGKFVLEALLDSPLPPPPPGADSFDESPEAAQAASLRERLERHRRDPQCAQCHAAMDPLGFALENYDATGRWRERDGRFAVDTKGVLPDGRVVDGPAGLLALLRADAAFPRSLAKHLLVYALGRGVNEADEGTIARLARTAHDDPRLSRLVEEIVACDAFRVRVPILSEEDDR